jgi:hypothetical protein
MPDTSGDDGRMDSQSEQSGTPTWEPRTIRDTHLGTVRNTLLRTGNLVGVLDSRSIPLCSISGGCPRFLRGNLVGVLDFPGVLDFCLVGVLDF